MSNCIFEPRTDSTSATICKYCGREKWEHIQQVKDEAMSKLYTEAQVNELRRALRDIRQWNESLEDEWGDAGIRADDALRNFDKLTPIELPTDEEIKEEAKKEILYALEAKGFHDGAKWMRDKIKGG